MEQEDSRKIQSGYLQKTRDKGRRRCQVYGQKKRMEEGSRKTE